MPSLVHVNIDRGIHKGKGKIAQNEKQNKNIWVFSYIKYSKFCSISLKHLIERKALISEEWAKK